MDEIRKEFIRSILEIDPRELKKLKGLERLLFPKGDSPINDLVQESFTGEQVRKWD